MKKYLVLGLLVFMLPIFVFAASKSTTVSYMVGEDNSYEWSVPASVTVSSTVTSNNLQQKPGHSAVIYVTASNVNLLAGNQLVIYYPHQGTRSLKNGNSSIRYYINEGEGDGVWTGTLAQVLTNNDLALRVQQSTSSATAPLEITVYESDIEAATALGEHTDTITFTAEVILND